MRANECCNLPVRASVELVRNHWRMFGSFIKTFSTGRRGIPTISSITHFLLDCFESEKLELIVGKLAETAREDAVWLIADFTLPKERFARAHATLWLRVMYAFFRLTARIKAKKLVDPTPYLEARGFIRTSMKLSRWRMLRANVYAAATIPVADSAGAIVDLLEVQLAEKQGGDQSGGPDN